MAKMQAERLPIDADHDDLEIDRERARRLDLAPEFDPDLAPTPVPSARPTSVPRFELDALASASVAFREARLASPLDIAIPIRTGRMPGQILSLRSAFLLLHVDGRSTIAQIAATADVPLSETITCFIDLVGSGVVDLTGGGIGPAVPQSGVQRRDDP